MKKIFLVIVSVAMASYSFGQWTISGTNIYSSNTGNVGVGTANPQALLDVGKEISGGAVGTVLARQNEGDGPGGGTSLNARAWETQFTNFNGKSFSLEHSFYGMLNSSINFYRGSGQTGGYMAFATNNGKEQMIISALGNVGIGITSPSQLLSVNGNVLIQNSSASSQGYLFSSPSTNWGPQLSGLYFTPRDGTNATSDFSIRQWDGTYGTPQWGSVATRFFISGSDGSVGIGTINPAFKLDVQGGNASVYNNGGLSSMILGSAATGKTSLNFYTSADASGYGVIQSISASGTAYGSMAINPSGGNVGIGTANPGSYRLAVNGGIHSQSVNVDLTGWSDYVFKHDYILPSLIEVKAYIDQNHHLPDMPSEKEVINEGINLGEMNKLLTKKVEELTLYVIEQDKNANEQKAINQRQGSLLKSQQEQIDDLKTLVNKLMDKQNKDNRGKQNN